ncbi:DUF4185 domain-containing protein [Nocardia mexicana]|uniref:Uncharacterized protein DUF4185 n=1 Tax=Nocardia mexicana TaxID=279262 RepID=A0A370H006_9NOCA|nr:DUF4185 domain-containing protein [Nocardia mexicana]RDI49231.1 uncharacterized protein DUF4185 [Nocardia mexicana]
MHSWNELWRNVIARTVPTVRDLSAVFKSEYDDTAFTLRGTAESLSHVDQAGRRLIDSCDGPEVGSGATGSRLRVIAARPHHELNTLLSKYAYSDDDGWTGGDSTYVRRLPDGRHVMMFSDTFLGRVAADGTRVRETPFVSNSFVVIERSGEMRTVLGRTPGGQLRAVLPPEGDQFHWLGGSHVTRRNTLDVMFLRFTGDSRVTDTGGDFDAERLRTALIPGGQGELEHRANLLARFDARDLRLLDVTPMPSDTGVHWASWVEHDPRTDHSYVYGVTDAGADKYMHIARVPGDDLRQQWEFFDGQGGWSPREADSAPLMSGVANEYSVARLDDKRFLLVTQDTTSPYSPDIVGYLSDSPTGPFTSPTLLYRTTESGPLGFFGDGDVVVYNAHEQPDLRRGNELTITYNLNSSVQGVLDDSAKYRPNAVNVKFELD